MNAAVEMLMPPGWAHVDLAGDARMEIGQAVGRLVRQAPPARQPRVRETLEAALVPRLLSLSEEGVSFARFRLSSASSPLFPLVSVHVGQVPLAGGEDSGESAAMGRLLAIAGSDSTAELVDIAPLLAVRTVLRATVEPDALVLEVPALDESEKAAAEALVREARTRWSDAERQLERSLVQYLVCDPDDPATVVTAQFAVEYPRSSEAIALARAEEELFDLCVRAMRWAP